MHILQEEVALSVIVCYHVGDLLQRCLDSVRKSEQIKYEIIVVSSIPAIQVGEDVLLIHSVEGPAYKRNLASRFARGKYLVFLDDDVTISPYTLYHLWQFMERHKKTGIGFAKIFKMTRRNIFDDCGSFLLYNGFIWSRAGNEIEDKGQYDSPCMIFSSKSATCIARRSSFLDVGGFDSSYYILGEESDLSFRMWLKGYEVWYIPEARSWHAFGCEEIKPTKEFYNISRIHRNGSRNYIQMLLTNVGTFRLSFMLPLHLFGWLLAIIFFCLKGQLNRAFLIILGFFDVLRTIPNILKKRKKIQDSRVISDKDLFEIILKKPPKGYFRERLLRYVIRGRHG